MFAGNAKAAKALAAVTGKLNQNEEEEEMARALCMPTQFRSSSVNLLMVLTLQVAELWSNQARCGRVVANSMGYLLLDPLS